MRNPDDRAFTVGVLLAVAWPVLATLALAAVAGLVR